MNKDTKNANFQLDNLDNSKKKGAPIDFLHPGHNLDQKEIEERLHSPRLSELTKEWYRLEKIREDAVKSDGRTSLEIAHQIDLLRFEILEESLLLLEKINLPGSYRNLLITASCLYYKAGRYRIYELIQVAQRFERIAMHQLQLPESEEGTTELFKGLPKARELMAELMMYVDGEKPFDKNQIKKLDQQLSALYHDSDANKVSPYSMGRIRFDCSEVHIEFNTLTQGGWIISQLMLEAESLGVTNFESYLSLNNRLRSYEEVSALS